MFQLSDNIVLNYFRFTLLQLSIKEWRMRGSSQHAEQQLFQAYNADREILQQHRLTILSTFIISGIKHFFRLSKQAGFIDMVHNLALSSARLIGVYFETLEARRQGGI